MFAFNPGAMKPSMVHSIVDSFFLTKKVEMKQQLHLEMDRVVDNLFGQLVSTVKDLLIPTAPTTKTAFPKKSPFGDYNSDLQFKYYEASLKTNASKSAKPKTKQSRSSRSESIVELPKTQEHKFFKSRSVNQPNQITTAGHKHTSHLPSTAPINQQPKMNQNQYYAVKSYPGTSSSAVPTYTKRNMEACKQRLFTTRQVEAHTNSGQIMLDITYASDDHVPSENNLSRPVKRQRISSHESQLIASNNSQGNSTKKIPGKHACELDGCDKRFVNPKDLKRHQRGVHLKIKPYICKWPHCSYASATKDATLRHIRMSHLNKRNPTNEHGGPPNLDPNVYLKVDQQLLN